MKKLLLLFVLLPSIGMAQIITTIAGNGTAGHAGDGGLATTAKIHQPTTIAFDLYGNLYICDYGSHCIRKVNTSGIITTIAGTTIVGYSGDGGPATAAQLRYPVGVFADSHDNIYISDGGVNSCIRKINSSGVITTIAGSGASGYSGNGGPATIAQMSGPARLYVASSGSLYIPEIGNHCIRYVDPAGVISTIAGTTVAGFSGDGGPATAAQLNGPRSVVIDGAGNIIIADAYNNRIRKIDNAGNISTIAGITIPGFSGDGGPATLAKLNYPDGLFVDGCGNIIFTDDGNQRIRFINPSGVINTIAGTGTVGFSGDGAPATSAQFHGPSSVVLNAVGDLYVADALNQRIRKFHFGCENTTYSVSQTKPYIIDIYPNPANTEITITAPEKINQITIINLIGQQVFSSKYNAEKVEVNIEGLPTGVYFITINGSEIKRFVKQ